MTMADPETRVLSSNPAAPQEAQDDLKDALPTPKPAKPVATHRQKKRYVRPDAPPTTPMQWIWWLLLGRLYGRFGWRWILNLSKVTAEERVQRLRRAVKGLLMDQSLTILTLGQKGGCGKTQNAVNKSLGLGEALKQNVVTLGMNKLGRGDVIKRMGMNTPAWTTSSLVDHPEWIQDVPTLCRNTANHPVDGLENIRGIPFGGASMGDEPSVNKVMALIATLVRFVHTLVIDGGQDPNSNWVQGAIRSADVIEVNALAGQLDSIEDALQTLRSVERVDEDSAGKCFLVIHAHKGEVTEQVVKSYYDRALSIIADEDVRLAKREQETGIREENSYALVPLNRVFVIPFDPVLYDETRPTASSDISRTGTTRPQDLEDFQLETWEAILQSIMGYAEIVREVRVVKTPSVSPALPPMSNAWLNTFGESSSDSPR